MQTTVRLHTPVGVIRNIEEIELPINKDLPPVLFVGGRFYLRNIVLGINGYAQVEGWSDTSQATR